MKIAILMSTYNGEQFLSEQLDSIFNQTDVDFDLYIRDDKSSDRTVDVIKSYNENHEGVINLVCGKKNIGAIRSFEWLINKVPIKYDFYAFADQDDIWYPDKLISAVNMFDMESKETPQLYVCNQNCVDGNKCFLYKRFPDYFLQDSIMDTMLNNQYSGCTMVLNNSLMNAVRMTYKEAGKSLRVIYDVWIMSVAQACGKVYYDNTPHMDFRRHEGNVTQASFGKNLQFSDVKKRFFNMFKTLKNYSYYKGYTSYRAKLLLKCFEDEMNNDEISKVSQLASYRDSVMNWLRMVLVNPLWKYYQPPKIITWLRFFVRIY